LGGLGCLEDILSSLVARLVDVALRPLDPLLDAGAVLGRGGLDRRLDLVDMVLEVIEFLVEVHQGSPYSTLVAFRFLGRVLLATWLWGAL
jgi:hypothetical protein